MSLGTVLGQDEEGLGTSCTVTVPRAAAGTAGICLLPSNLMAFLRDVEKWRSARQELPCQSVRWDAEHP